MTTPLPIPLAVRLPDGWLAVPPDELGAERTAFVAVHPGSRADFTAYLTLGGQRRGDDADVRVVADELFRPIEHHGHRAEIVAEAATGDATAPGLTRLVAMRIDVEGVPTDLKQCQVLVTVPEVGVVRHRTMLWFTLTATDEQLPLLAPDFEAFVASADPAPASD